jgi:hypothetical protein
MLPRKAPWIVAAGGFEAIDIAAVEPPLGAPARAA